MLCTGGRVSEGETYIILGTTVSGRATAAVIIAVSSGAGASHTTLGASANIDVRDRGDIRAAWGG